jgi:hypothetical protein
LVAAESSLEALRSVVADWLRIGLAWSSAAPAFSGAECLWVL